MRSEVEGWHGVQSPLSVVAIQCRSDSINGHGSEPSHLFLPNHLPPCLPVDSVIVRRSFSTLRFHLRHSLIPTLPPTPISYLALLVHPHSPTIIFSLTHSQGKTRTRKRKSRVGLEKNETFSHSRPLSPPPPPSPSPSSYTRLLAYPSHDLSKRSEPRRHRHTIKRATPSPFSSGQHPRLLLRPIGPFRPAATA